MGGVHIEHGDLNNREVIDSLVEVSENQCREDLHAKVTTVANSWSECVCGWKAVIPAPKYQKVPPAKKKRAVGKDDKSRIRRPHLPNVRLPSLEALAARTDRQWPWEGSSSPEGDANGWMGHNIRCVDEDYITTGTVAPWKANVEPVTYRYVPNTGAYRKNKTVKQRDEQERKAALPLSWYQRKLQKEIQRDLKRGLELQKLSSKPHASNIASGTDNPREAQLDRERSKSDATLQHSGTIANPRLSPPVMFHALDDPLTIHAVNDKFIESFTSRLSALDDEIQRDANLFRKSRPEEELKGAFVRGKIKDSRVTPLGAEALTQETFSIKPLRGRPQLRPLEKITPQQRITQDLSRLAVAQLKYTTVSSGEPLNLPVDSAVFNASNGRLLTDSQQHYKRPLGTGLENEGGDALQTAITTTKVVPNNKYSITKLLTTGKPPTRKNSDKDSISSDKILTSPRMTTHIEKEFNADRNHTGQTLEGEFFPGISGKHLTVSLV